MIALVVVPLLAALLLDRFAGALAERLPPGVAVPLLAGLALTVALCNGFVLCALAILVGAQIGPLAAMGHWSASAVGAGSGFPVVVGVVAALVVAACLTSAARMAVRSIRALAAAARAARSLDPAAGGDLVVIVDEEPVAYAVAGGPGRIVVSTAMLAALSGPERRVLLAHEASHLRHRHHLYLHLTRLAGAADPLLRRLPAAVERGIERWADEDAAAEVGDRRLVARAVARAAMARTARGPGLAGALAVADLHVVPRVEALLAPATPLRRNLIGLAVGGGLVCWAAAMTATWWVHQLIQVAEAAYLHH